ncbi:MAG: glycosyltransferase family 39 protein, partial [Acidobacteria bacterium]|nr:glycosyltransferase family 39 protein [Acidobacteriota bacterium]
MTNTSSPSARWWTLLVALLLVAAAVRWLAWQPFRDVDTLRGDEAYYVRTARSIAAGEGHPGSFRPPLYPAAMALVLEASGDDLDAVRWAQIGLGLLLVVLVADLARRRFDERAGFVAGLAAAVQPSLVHYSHFLWSELLAATLLAATLWCLARWCQSRAMPWLIAGGLVLGATALTKEIWLYFAVVVAAWILWSSRTIETRGKAWPPRRAWISALVFVLSAAAVVLPWTVRNTRLQGAPVLISTCRWFPIAVGNLLPEDDWLLGDGRGGEERREIPAGLDELGA